MEFHEGGLDEPRVVALLAHHLATATAATAHGSAHALDVDALRAPDIRFWSLWEGDRLLGVAALKRLSGDHGELKSMHVADAARRRGVGRRLIEHLVAQARAAGLTRLSLETGSRPYFAPARALYRSMGFAHCAPFEGYAPDANSVFMTRAL